MPMHGVVFWRKAWKKFGMAGSFHISIPLTDIPLDLAKKNQRAVWIVFALHIKEKSTRPNISG